MLLSSHLDGDAARATARRVAHRIHQLPGARAGGELLAKDEIQQVATRDAAAAEKVSTPITAVAMAVIFAGLIAALIPFSVAGASILCALMALLGGAQFTGVSSFAQNIVTLLGLGLGIDYGLLAVYRFREHRAAGLEVGDAVASTVATAGRTITFSALIVAVSMCGMLLITTDDLRSLAIGGIAVTLAAAVSAVTLLPASCPSPPDASGPRDGPPAGPTTGRSPRSPQRCRPTHFCWAAPRSVCCCCCRSPFCTSHAQLADERFLPAGDEVRTVEQTMRRDFPALATNPTVVVADVDTEQPDVRRLRARGAGASRRRHRDRAAEPVRPHPPGHPPRRRQRHR